MDKEDKKDKEDKEKREISNMINEYLEISRKGLLFKLNRKRLEIFISAISRSRIRHLDHHVNRLIVLYQITVSKKLSRNSIIVAVISAILSIVSIVFVIYGIRVEKRNLEIKEKAIQIEERKLEIEEGRWQLERSNDTKYNTFKGGGILEGYKNKK